MKVLCCSFLFCLSTFLAAAQSLETVIQKGHELAVVAVALSPDSNYIATGSKDKSAKLWEVATRREVRSFLGHDATVTALAFSPDGTLLATGSNDRAIRIWDVHTGREVHVRRTNNYITGVAFDPNQRFLVYTGYNDSGRGDSAIVFDYKNHNILRRIPVNPDKGLGKGVMAAVSPDGKWLALGEDNRKVQLLRTDDWTVAQVFEHPEGFCGGCVAVPRFSADGRQLFVATRNGDLKVYSMDDFTSRTILYETGDVSAMSLSHDAMKVVLVNEDEAKVISGSDGKILISIPAKPKAKFNDALFLGGDRNLIIASDDNTGIVFDLGKRSADKPFAGFLAYRDNALDYDPNFYWQSHIARYVRLKSNLVLSRDGKSLIKGKFGTRVKRWDIASGRTIMEYAGHTKAVLAVAQSRDGSRLLTGGGDGKIVLWKTATGDSIMAISAYREPVFDVRFSDKEDRILSSSWDGTMRVHNAETGELVAHFPLDNSSAFTTAFHPSGLYTVTGRLDNSLQMWETDTRTVVRNFVGHTGVVSAILFSKDGKILVTSGWDGTVRRWDVGTGLMIEKIIHGTSPVHAVITDALEKKIYSAGADRLIKIWEPGSGKLLGTLAGHNADIVSLSLDSEGKMLISHSLDGVTKFWNLESGKEFFEHIHLGEHDWLVKNGEGYFSGTDGARKFIHFVDGLKTYSVDQFFQEFYRPDLLPKIFQTRSSGDESRGIYGKLQNAPPPELKIALVPAGNDQAELLVRMINTGAGVGRLRVLHNGKSLALPEGKIEYPGQGKHTDFRMKVGLIGGNNTFTAIASNRDNVESDPRSVEFFTESEVKHNDCYILAVGIDEYQNPRLNLNYAKSDAVSLSKVLGGLSRALFNNVIIDTVFDKDATKAGILHKLDEIAGKVRPEDVFVFYYAGHGSMVENRFYFIPTENARLFDASGLRKQAIEAGAMQEKLKNIKALKQLIILDACQSGGSVELLAVRGAGEERAIAQLSRSTGIHVLASAGSEQFAAEFAELGHGLFTYVLVKGLNGEADGAPRDGKVTIYELKSYIDDQVPEMTRKLKGKPQYPYTFSRGHDFPVVIRR